MPYRQTPFVSENFYHLFNRGVEKRIIFYRNAILYGNYEENGSFPDFLKGLVRELDLKDPSQDDFNKCLRN